jgi:ABC-type multidrug transport system fused ATPase/permease subunit
MSLDARNKVIKIVSEKLGFSFKEEDLSPKLRGQIGTIAIEIDKADALRIASKYYEREASKFLGYAVLCGIIGIFLLLFIALTLIAVLPGLLFLGIAYILYNTSMREERKARDIRSKVNEIWSEVIKNILQLSELIYSELSALYEARVRPTIRQITIDFASIIQAVKDKGIILGTIECPYCKAPIELPTKGESFKCQYCGKMIKAIDIFDKLKSILAPN